MSVQTMVNAVRWQRILDATAGQTELRTHPRDMPLDARGLTQTPPAQLLESTPTPG